MIHNYDIQTTLGVANLTFDDDDQSVTCKVANSPAHNFTTSYDLIDKIHQQLEDNRFVAKMK